MPITAPPKPPPGRSPAVRVAALVSGSLLALLASGLLAVGALSLWGDSQRDDQGYLATGSDRFTTHSYALATDNLDVDLDGAGWLVDRTDYGKVRLEVAPRGNKPVFVGVARTKDVAGYLQGIGHALVTDVDHDPFKPSYRQLPGLRRPASPAEQGFWAASTHGPGTQTLTWDVTDGDWSVVVMNADASAGVDAGVSAGARVSYLGPLGWGALGGGLVLLLAAGGLVVLAAKPPRSSQVAPGAEPRTAVVA